MVAASAASADFSRYSKPPPLGGGAFTDVLPQMKLVGFCTQTVAACEQVLQPPCTWEDALPEKYHIAVIEAGSEPRSMALKLYAWLPGPVRYGVRAHVQGV